jgi:Na+/proline symporter
MNQIAPLPGWAMYVILLGWAGFLLLLVIFVGKARGRTAELFLSGGRDVGHGMINASLTATWLWAAAFIMASWVGWTHGFIGTWWYCIGACIPLPIMAFMARKVKVIMPLARSYPEYIHFRLDKKNQILYSFFSIFTAGWLAIMIIQCMSGMCFTFSTAPYWTIAAITAVTFFSYILVSGLWSAIFADTVMAMVIMVVAVILVIGVFKKVGVTGMYEGLMEVFQTKPRLQPGSVESIKSQWTPLHWLAPLGLGFLVVNTVGNLGGLMVNQAFWSRMTGAYDEKVTFKSFMTAGFCWWVIPFAPALAFGVGGLAMQFKVGELYQMHGANILFAQPDSISPLMSFFASGYLGMALFFVGVAACSISTGAGVILGGVTVITNNIIKGWLKPDATGKQILRWSRLFLILFTGLIFAIVLILKAVGFSFPGMYQALGVGVSGAVPPLILTIFWKKANRNGVFWGVIISTVGGLGYWIGVANFDLLWGVVWGNVIVMVVSTLVTTIWTWIKPEPFNENTLKEKVFQLDEEVTAEKISIA